jgi:hypothetical protein
VPASGRPDDVWWIGADFGHTWDLAPGRDAFMRQISDEHRERGNYEIAAVFEKVCAPPFCIEETYRELPYVRAEVERLAEQLAALTLQTATIEIA